MTVYWGFIASLTILACTSYSALRSALRGESTVRRGVVRFCLTVGLLAALLLALAQPQGTTDESPPAHRYWLCLDVSRSMLAADAEPNRLERGKQILREAVSALAGRGVGLVAVGGKPVLLVPPTNDHTFLKESVRRLAVNSAPGPADLIAALELISSTAILPGSDVVVLVSDGGHDSIDLKEGLLKGLTVHTVGIGSTEEASPVVDPVDGRLITSRGKPILTRLNEATLRQLASATAASYTRSNEDLEIPPATISNHSQGKTSPIQPFIIPALAAVFLAALLTRQCW